MSEMNPATPRPCFTELTDLFTINYSSGYAASPAPTSTPGSKSPLSDSRGPQPFASFSYNRSSCGITTR
jgi:hypothetical protein